MSETSEPPIRSLASCHVSPWNNLFQQWLRDLENEKKKKRRKKTWWGGRVSQRLLTGEIRGEGAEMEKIVETHNTPTGQQRANTGCVFSSRSREKVQVEENPVLKMNVSYFNSSEVETRLQFRGFKVQIHSGDKMQNSIKSFYMNQNEFSSMWKQSQILCYH